RHPRATRPAPCAVPRCLITGMMRMPGEGSAPELDRGSSRIYTRHLLLRSAALLLDYIHDERPLRLPQDVPELVRACYGGANLGPARWGSDLAEAQSEDDDLMAKTAKDATADRLRAPGESRLSVGILGANAGEAEADIGAAKQVRQDD